MIPPARVDAGGNCIVDLKQPYEVAGTLQGSMEVDYRILVAGPCGAPAGTYIEDWIAHGSFRGKYAGTAVSATLSYMAHVAAGGQVAGQISFADGLDGIVRVTGRFSDGVLHYAGGVHAEPVK